MVFAGPELDVFSEEAIFSLLSSLSMRPSPIQDAFNIDLKLGTSYRACLKQRNDVRVRYSKGYRRSG